MFKLIWLIRDRNYWKQRSESLEAKLDTERAANRAHEDQILSRFVSLHGVVGVEAREPEKSAPKQTPHTPDDFEQVIKGLNGYDRAMLEMYEEEGLARGIALGQIHKDFYQEHVLGRQRIEEVPQ